MSTLLLPTETINTIKKEAHAAHIIFFNVKIILVIYMAELSFS